MSLISRKARIALCCLSLPAGPMALAQCDRWQQRVKYTMEVSLDTRTHAFDGSSRIVYTNSSPDTLREVFFHLYFNAFQPNSEMDMRSRTIADPDPRVQDRIIKLKPEEQGRLTVHSLLQEGIPTRLEHRGTVLKVFLSSPILPRSTATFDLDFTGQVPKQIRRSGRDNSEGISYSMTQWYPKLAEYDHHGWHATPYVGREFHGVWGDFDVKLTLDSSFTIAATGVLQNPTQIGHGYGVKDNSVAAANGQLTWHFVAENVHDFAWSADPDYVHEQLQMPDGPLLHVFFQPSGAESVNNWHQLAAYMAKSFAFMSEHFGKYPWPQYSFAQGGDGGMEYPMLTLITGKRGLGSLVGVSVHESVHSWYYGALASNEGKYAWMDEGFTEYASSEAMRHLFGGVGDPHLDGYKGYFDLVKSGNDEPLSVHADHFLTNHAYGTSAYTKGEMFLHQLSTVIGDKTVHTGMLDLWNACAFKHPEPIDVKRVMEKRSGIELDWYFDEWINTTRTLDYTVSGIERTKDSVRVTLKRLGDQLMPVDVEVLFDDSSKAMVHVPLSLMLGEKANGSEAYSFTTVAPWTWTHFTYSFNVAVPKKRRVLSVAIDPTKRMADIARENDRLELPEGEKAIHRE
ncbi:MAG: M1 family metallopeptidase [Flavobacteriales bacterium]|nr:M1 family metallopeptidase [Flavobacteriales bacterium]